MLFYKVPAVDSNVNLLQIAVVGTERNGRGSCPITRSRARNHIEPRPRARNHIEPHCEHATILSLVPQLRAHLDLIAVQKGLK